MVDAESLADRSKRRRFTRQFEFLDSLQLQATAILAFARTSWRFAHAADEIFGIFIQVSDKPTAAFLAGIHGQHVAVHEFHQTPGTSH